MPHMDVYEIRKLRLRELVAEVGSQKQVAENADTDANNLSAILSDTIGQQMGSDLARRLDHAHGKPTGWMDTAPDDLGEVFRALPAETRREVIDFMRYKIDRAEEREVRENLAAYQRKLDQVLKDLPTTPPADDPSRDNGPITGAGGA